MAKLCLVQQRDSICRTVLFTVFLVLTTVNQCRPTSNQEICITSDTRKVSYFKINNEGLDWHTAWQTCNEQNSILPVICNKNEQDALTNYLSATLGSSEVWTSGKKINIANWTWIDGQPLNDRGISSGHATYTHVALDGARGYSAQSPQHKNYYLCHYSGSSCNSEHVVNVTNGCVRPSDDYQTWYEARNQCLKNGSDLAVLTEADLDTLRKSNKLDVRRSYWIGLRTNAWHWIWNRTANSSQEIKYTNWSNITQSSTDECISINASNGEWKSVGCMHRSMVVCEGASDATTSTASPSTTTASAMSSNTKSTMSDMSESKTQIYSGVGAGIVIIVICIIVIILAVRYTRKFPKDIDHSKDEENSEYKFNEFENEPDNSSANASDNAPVADEMRGVYAEIPLATFDQLEGGVNAQPPGIVYASIEFLKEPIYLEPHEKRAHTTDTTKIGPLGDIYAMPNAKGHAVTWPARNSE